MNDELLPNPIAIEPELEQDPALQKWANAENCALFALIAPYIGKRISPVSEVYASIGMQEEFGIESFIDQCVHAKVKKLHMLVNSPGGGVVSSYKIAKALRSQFTEIRVFVPHMAASGGTLIALTGDEIVMGIMSHLSPLDPQCGLPPFYGPVAVRVGSTVTVGSSGRCSTAESARGAIAPYSAGVRYPSEL